MKPRLTYSLAPTSSSIISKASSVMAGRMAGGRTAANGEAMVIGALRESVNFTILWGPRPEDEAALRQQHGYEPEAFDDAIRQLAAREQAFGSNASRRDREQGAARRHRGCPALRLGAWRPPARCPDGTR